MARKTFISYKYSEAADLRDEIIRKLGDDATYYQGERADSPDMSDDSVEQIKSSLKDMMFDTSVMIVVISPNLFQSNWVDWEIEYSLKEITREERTSHNNGIVGVIMKMDGNYDWLVSHAKAGDGCTYRMIDDTILYPIINNNRFNLNTENKYTCPTCKTMNSLNGSYISLITEDKFLGNPDKYIENAYDKSKSIDEYDISKVR